MKRIDLELKILSIRFDEMGLENQGEILKNQFSFKDFFAHNIYKQELKNGTIEIYPKAYLEINNVQIDESKFWEENEFYAIIDEWSIQAPKMKFINLGNYILFFKSIFFKEFQLANSSVSLKERINSKTMKIKMKDLKGGEQELRTWKLLEEYFYIKGIERIRRK